MWETGTIGTYSYEAKVYEEPSKFGINGGRISILDITDSNKKCVCFYDRMWVIEPDGDELKEVYEQILEKFN